MLAPIAPDLLIKATPAGMDTDVVILGREKQNRALHGDAVYVELLPRSEWALPSSKHSETQNTQNTVPSGRVVAIAQRNWRPCAIRRRETCYCMISDRVMV